MQDLKLNTSLPALSFDYDGLKAWALDFTEKYRGLAVTEDAVADVKRDMAEINKAKKAVDDARKEAVRRVSEPIRTFETQVKEICGIFDAAYAELGVQVKAYEDAQREGKRKIVEGIIQETLNQMLDEDERFTIPIQDKWLNKASSLKSIREDVEGIVYQHVEEVQRHKELVQAKQDRAAAIENHVAALNSLRGLNLPLSRFLGGDALSLSTPLASVLVSIEDSFNIEDGIRKAEQRARATLASASAEQSEPKAEPQTRAMSIVLEYDLAQEAAVKACLTRLEGLCRSFGARTR